MDARPFYRLPVEIRQEILSAISDIDTLKSAALCCRSLYAAFLGVEPAITRRVLHNEFDRPFRREALIALASSRLGNISEEKASDFCSDYLGLQPHVNPTSTLKDAIALARIHKNVEYFKPRLISYAIENAPENALDDEPPTASEVFRIERTIYVYEIFANLLRGRILSNDYFTAEVQGDELCKAFFSSFAPEEMEQLACVNNFFIHLAVSAYNNFTEHDVLWGYWGFSWLQDTARGYVEQILNHDLDYIRRMDESNDPNTWLEFSRYFELKKFKDTPEVLLMGDALRKFKWCVPRSTGDGETIAKAVFFDDDNVGPRDVWEWAEDGSNMGNINDPEQASLRRWCYVMWDDTRLDRMGLMEEDWEPPEQEDDSEEELAKKSEYMHCTFDLRKRISDYDGSGYASFEDLSFVVWRKGRPAVSDEDIISSARPAWMDKEYFNRNKKSRPFMHLKSPCINFTDN